jgi:hypothetical protein
MYWMFSFSFTVYFVLMVGFGSQCMKKNDLVLFFDQNFAKFMVFIVEEIL